MITYLAWYTLVITTLSVFIIVFSNNKKSFERFLVALFNTPIIVFAYKFLFNN